MKTIEELKITEFNVYDNDAMLDALLETVDKLNGVIEQVNALKIGNMPVTDLDNLENNCGYCDHVHIRCKCGCIKL